MKFADNIAVIEKSGNIGKEAKFSLKNTSKMFSVFFDHLYSNKIRAIIRELYSNAYDAHVNSNMLHKQPQLHLPNAWEPEFIIRDFGTGIHPDDIEQVYTVVFESTKTNTNDEIGGFGLGSKTPFCYTSNFGVRSFYDGMVYSYAMFTDEGGEPTYSLVASAETTEPNGLEVKFAVNRSDFRNFENEAIEALRYFELKPELTGAKITYPKVDKVLEGTGWYMTAHQTYYGTNSSKPQVLVGPVAYPLDISSFKDQLTDNERAAANASLVLNVGIGDVEVAPSREALSYNAHTISCLKIRLKEIVTELTDRVTAKLHNAKSNYEKKALYLDIVEELNLSGATNCINTGLIFGHNVSYNSIAFYDIKKKGLDIVEFVKDRTNGFRMIKKVESLKPTMKAEFFFEDGVHAPHNRCENYVKNHADDGVKVYLIKGQHVPTLKPEFITLLGINDTDIKAVSTLTYVKPVVQKAAGGQKLFRVGLYDNYKFKEDTIDPNTEGYYVVQRFNQVYGDDNTTKHVHERHFFRFMESLKNAGIILDKPLYGLRTDQYNKVKSNPKWVNLFTHLQGTLCGKLKVNELWADYQRHDRLYQNLKKLHPHVPATSDFAAGAKKLIDSFDDAKKIAKYSDLINKLNSDYLVTSNTTNVKTVEVNKDFEQLVENKYPILHHWEILDGWMDGKVAVIADYVKLIG